MASTMIAAFVVGAGRTGTQPADVVTGSGRTVQFSVVRARAEIERSPAYATELMGSVDVPPGSVGRQFPSCPLPSR